MNQYDLVISQEYNKLPFHNWQHGQEVAERVMLLLGLKYASFVHPGEMAGKLHDAGHLGGILDAGHEIRANTIGQKLLKQANFSQNYCNKVAEYIMGTEFSKRGELETKDQQIIADSDIALIGGDYLPFVQEGARLLIEENKNSFVSDNQIIDFFKIQQPKFFSYLTSVTNNDSNPFLTQEAQRHFPHYSRNIDIIAQDIEENPQKLIDIVRSVED